MAITSREIRQSARNTPRERKKDFGQIEVADVRDVFIRVVHVAAWLLLSLSVIGTFYAFIAAPVPLPDLLRIATDIARMPERFALALLVQGILAVTQWGARIFAFDDARWWGVYVVSLALSASLNWSAYAPTLIAWKLPLLAVLVVILVGDILPELVLVKHEAEEE